MPPTAATRGGPGLGMMNPPVARGTVHQGGIGRGLSGKTVLSGKRHRRLARRGGVKRISAGIYGEARHALKDFLVHVIRDCTIYVEYRNTKTITINDVIHSLRRIGRPIYGFDPDTAENKAKVRRDMRHLPLRYR